MPDIQLTFTINAPVHDVFDGISTPKGLDNWWTKSSSGTAEENAEFDLNFGPQCAWRARVTKVIKDKSFELTLTKADGDWMGSKVGFLLNDQQGGTQVEFYHKDWPQDNEHYRISCYCWAMYLRILKRYLEYGEFVPYEQRLNV